MGELYEIYLPDLKRPIQQFKLCRDSVNRLPWVILSTGGTCKVGTVCILVNISPPYWSMNATILSGDQWFNAHAVVRSGNFRVSGRMGLLFGPNQSLFSLPNQQLLDFQSFLSSSEAGCWVSGQFF